MVVEIKGSRKKNAYYMVCYSLSSSLTAMVTEMITSFNISFNNLGMVMYTFNPTTWEAEAGGFQWVLGQPVLCRDPNSNKQTNKQTTIW